MALEEAMLAIQDSGANLELTWNRLSEQDWTEAWKWQYQRLRVGQRLVVVPAWETYEPVGEEIDIRLEPGMAFGTGLHATTRLCLQALEALVTPGVSVLDVGTGSGILAIAAARLGARSVLALDSDSVAVVAAQENATANNVAGRVTVRRGSLPGGDGLGGHVETASKLDLLVSGSYDLVLVNILAPTIEGTAPALAARLKSGGRLVAAGLIETQERSVVRSLAAEGLQVVRRAQEEDWICLVLGKG
jgi:ribosomal protein L11 methyltransferase